MKQKWVPYTEWEDYKFGMWGKSNDEDNDLKKAIDFTSFIHSIQSAFPNISPNRSLGSPKVIS